VREVPKAILVVYALQDVESPFITWYSWLGTSTRRVVLPDYGFEA
jgi:hypothetical protein